MSALGGNPEDICSQRVLLCLTQLGSGVRIAAVETMMINASGRCQPQSLWRRTLLLPRLDCHARGIPASFVTKRRLPNRFRALPVLQYRIEPPRRKFRYAEPA